MRKAPALVVAMLWVQPLLAADPPVEFPPLLPGGREVVVVESKALLKAPATIRADVEVAKKPPRVTAMYYPGQDYPGKPWSVWGDGSAVEGKYYSAIGDHLGPQGNAFVYEYDAKDRAFRKLTDVRSVIDLPDGHYTPGKIHSRIDLGRDGRLYFSTHRGSTRVTNDMHHYRGDWIMACDPKSGKTEVVAHAPVPKHCIPTSVLDPERLIFYGATTPGESRGEEDGIHFFAYDIGNKKLLHSAAGGPSRYFMFASSSGRVYFTAGAEGKSDGRLWRYDPAEGGEPVQLDCRLGLRAATRETPQGVIYVVSEGRRDKEAMLYAFDTKTETVEELGAAAAGTQQYITSLDADPAGRYLYYIPGAHGGSSQDGAAIVRFDTKTRKKSVVAFLHPAMQEAAGCLLQGTFSSAVDPRGDRLYITWNVSRGGRAWDSCLLTEVELPGE